MMESIFNRCDFVMHIQKKIKLKYLAVVQLVCLMLVPQLMKVLINYKLFRERSL